MAGFTKAIKLFYSGYFEFSGRSPRSEYWWVILFQTLVLVLGAFLIGMFGTLFGLDVESEQFELYIYVPLGIFLVINFIPNVALAIRRFHDLGQTGWLVLIFNVLGNIPFLGLLIFAGQMIWYALPGNRGPNQYGEDPLSDGVKSVFD